MLSTIIKEKIIQNTFIRAISIATLNFIFYSKTIKSWFEKHIFNPYEIDGNESADYALMQLRCITKHLDVSGKTILEIGPGGSYYLACLLLQEGAKKVFVIDNENHNFFSKKEIIIYRNLFSESIQNEKINQEKIEVLHYEKNGQIPLPPETCDIIYSNAVFEHVNKPQKLLLECERLLKKDGQMMHQIDFRDHIFDQKFLFFLKVPAILFDTLYKNTGMWVNRLRYSEWIDIFSSLKKMKISISQKQYGILLPTKQTSEDHKITSALFILKKHVS